MGLVETREQGRALYVDQIRLAKIRLYEFLANFGITVQAYPSFYGSIFGPEFSNSFDVKQIQVLEDIRSGNIDAYDNRIENIKEFQGRRLMNY
jgi:hypothetical protein